MSDRLTEILGKIAKDAKLTLCLDDVEFLEDKVARHLFLNDEIMSETVDVLIGDILRYNREDKAAGLAPEDRKPIKLFISSPGGSVMDGLRIVDAIEMSRTPVWTIVLGSAYSMACVVAIAGDKRFATPFSSFLIHDGSVMIYDSANKSNDLVDFNNACRERERRLMLSRTKIPETQLKEMERVEWYMFANRALELGLIDEILTVENGGFDAII